MPPSDLPTVMLGDLRLTPAADGPRRPRSPLVPVIVAAALVAIVAGVVIFLQGHSGSTAASGTTGTTPSATARPTVNCRAMAEIAAPRDAKTGACTRVR